MGDGRGGGGLADPQTSVKVIHALDKNRTFPSFIRHFVPSHQFVRLQNLINHFKDTSISSLHHA